MYANVIINRRVAAVDRVFTYAVPEALQAQVTLGSLVKVPFNRETLEGVIVEFPATVDPAIRLRNLKEIVGDKPLLPPELLQLSRWLADYYLCPWVAAMQAMLPAGLHLSGRLPKALYRSLYFCTEPQPQGLLTPKQRAFVEYVTAQAAGVSREGLQAAGFSIPMLRKLVTSGHLREEKQRITESGQPLPAEGSELSAGQQAVYAEIQREWQGPGRPYLLFGITGSGKTELYLRLIADMQAQGKQSIVLVPEIALSSQMLAMLRQRLPYQIAVLHSGLGQSERRQIWQDVAAGKIDVVVGARSAIFAPLPNLGLIVLDEEHESSYKQENMPRFHARRVALERCRLSGAHLILGSATPSVESYYEAEQGRYALGRLTQLYYPAAPPQVEIVDMREELRRGNRSIFSLALQTALGSALEQGEQAILFLNRRGYYQFFSCRACGEAITCPHCAVAMSYHRTAGGVLKCHYCGRTQVPPAVCPTCGSGKIRSFGVGTQRVEEELQALLPQARILRLDSDAMKERDGHERIYQAMRQGEADILVGTQMVAKGLDFPHVSVAAALAADSLLNLPDWRAAERTYQLLSQLCGRAGRRYKQGLAIIQTYTPQALPVQAAARQDYDNFYAAELAEREMHLYPPRGYLLRILLTARELQPLVRQAQSLGHYLQQRLPETVELCGPAAAPLERIKDRSRWQIILKGPDLGQLRKAAAQAVEQWQAAERVSDDIRVIVDVEPFTMV